MKTPGGQNFAYSGSELDSLAEAKNYYAWVLKQFEPYLGATVVEVGAGIGTFSDFILSVPRVKKLIAVEPAANTFPHLDARFANDPRVHTARGYLSDHFESIAADSVVAVNVLEHIADHQAVLEQARHAVNPGGSLLLFVPALPAIYGTLDTAFEHERRYTKRSLRCVIEAAGWRVERINYMNLPGIFAWFLAGRILRKTHIAGDETRTYDRLVIPWLARIESVVTAPVGSNLIAIARNPLQ